METAAIILAAGAGTRMKSKKPKVVHEVLGRPLVRWVVEAAKEAGADRVVTVVGHMRDQVIPLVEGDTEIVVQEAQRGTADAVLAAADAVEVLSPVFHRGCYAVRNDFLVDNASVVVGYYDGQRGGTAYTFRRAYSRGVPVVNICSGEPALFYP